MQEYRVAATVGRSQPDPSQIMCKYCKKWTPLLLHTRGGDRVLNTVVSQRYCNASHPACSGARKMAAALERSFIEICGFERETVSRFRDLIVNLGKK